MLDKNDFLSVVTHAPLVSIDLIAHDSEGRFLLGRRVNEPARGYWFVPGGRIYKNETLEQAFARITEAEIGRRLTLADADLQGVYEHFYSENFADAPGVSTHYVVLGYRLREPVDTDSLNYEQHSDYRWSEPDSILADPGVHANTRAYFLP